MTSNSPRHVVLGFVRRFRPGEPHPEQLAPLAKRAMSAQENHDDYPWIRFAEGLHHFRCGRFAEALYACEKSIERSAEDPPLIVRLDEQQVEQALRLAKTYRATLEPDRRLLLDRYEFVDAALKVVGVGSVGTRCFVVLLAGVADLDPLFLQIKEAQPSVLSPYTGRSSYRNQGQRVVVGQRIMQAASDVFLGWARADGFDTYVRQLRDMKGSAEIDGSDGRSLADYGRLCGATLARAHARSGDPALLAGYLGNGSAFDEALGRFAVAYADQTERDYEAFTRAVRTGRLEAIEGR